MNKNQIAKTNNVTPDVDDCIINSIEFANDELFDLSFAIEQLENYIPYEHSEVDTLLKEIYTRIKLIKTYNKQAIYLLENSEFNLEYATTIARLDNSLS